MPTKTKICGIATPEALDAAVAHGASHVGFNFYAPSPRCVSPEQARGLADRVPPHVARVGVFVDPDAALLAAAVASGALDILQLNATSAARRADVKARFALPVWAVTAVKTRADIAAAQRIDNGSADFILYDAATPAGSALPGGMGVRIDWAMMQGVTHRLPWGLAGGLTPDNVAEAVRITGATLVDVASGVESAPGIKDVDKIAAFLKAANP